MLATRVEMALVNFSLPYQSATMAPFLYTGGHTTANSLGLNTVLPPGSVPSYNEQETFRNEPYAPPVKYHQHRRQSAPQRSQEIYAEHTSFSSTQDTRYTAYNQDFRRIQPRLQQQQQQQMRPPPPSPFQQQQQHSRSPEPIKSRIEEQDQNYPERPHG